MKKKYSMSFAFGLLACVLSNTSISFELFTHGVLADKAYDASALGRSTILLTRLGLNDMTAPFGTVYYDFNELGIYKRAAYRYEQERMPRADNESFRVRGWMMRGAIREDDGGYDTAIAKRSVAEPRDDPFDNFNRFCNHFFDPVGARGLQPSFWDISTPILCASDNRRRAPDWATGAVDAFAASPQVASNYRNHFTVFTAREAMWRALTLKSKDGIGTTVRVFGDTDEQTRKAYWAATFRALGDVIHLVQDMAQPQHTRNEAHGFGHAALFEEYIDARANPSNREFRFDNETLTAEKLTTSQISAATIADYPPPTFNRYSDYWSTAPGPTSITSAGKGLADYSSRGFFTPGKNVDDSANDFVLPIRSSSAYQTFTSTPPSAEDCSPGGNLRRVKYLLGTVPDSITGAADPVRMASAGVLDGKYGINRCVMDDRANLLLSRAAAYSAGLIDYFFRGQMEITPPDEGIYSLVDHFDFSGAGKTATDATTGFKGFKTIKLKLRNTTPDITPSGGGSVAPQHIQNGKLVAILKFYRNKAYTDNLANEPASGAGYDATRSAAEEIVVSARVKDESGAPVDTISLSPDPATPAKLLYFEFDQELPINATDVKLQVVYRGTLGSEADAVVVQTVDISEPTYFAYMNTSDYIRLNAKVYTRAEINSNGTPPSGELSGSQLRALVRPTSCIDPMTDQLRASCFPEKVINFPLHVGTGSTENNTTLEFALPQVRTYVRMAMLTPRGVPALLDQRDSSCVPRDILPLHGRNVQTDYSTNADGSTRISTVVDFDPPPVRGVYGYVLSCVEIGDGTIPGANDPDNRDTKMAPLTGDALKPILLQNFKFGAP